MRVIRSGDPALSGDHAISAFLVTSRATIRRLFTTRCTADDILRGAGRRILTAWCYVPVISDGLMLTAAASFTRQAPHASGPLATLIAAVLVTPLPRIQYSLPPASVADPHLLLCRFGSGIQKMSIWILGGKD